mmetsp:Transcript_327/g.1286  ORF Transcript_327/g.1286 Transcript_327/m.1286 type:complete len:694 (-) Transcript_327:375-2456(-)
MCFGCEGFELGDRGNRNRPAVWPKLMLSLRSQRGSAQFRSKATTKYAGRQEALLRGRGGMCRLRLFVPLGVAVHFRCGGVAVVGHRARERHPAGELVVPRGGLGFVVRVVVVVVAHVAAFGRPRGGRRRFVGGNDGRGCGEGVVDVVDRVALSFLGAAAPVFFGAIEALCLGAEGEGAERALGGEEHAPRRERHDACAEHDPVQVRPRHGGADVAGALQPRVLGVVIFQCHGRVVQRDEATADRDHHLRRVVHRRAVRAHDEVGERCDTHPDGKHDVDAHAAERGVRGWDGCRGAGDEKRAEKTPTDGPRHRAGAECVEEGAVARDVGFQVAVPKPRREYHSRAAAPASEELAVLNKGAFASDGVTRQLRAGRVHVQQEQQAEETTNASSNDAPLSIGVHFRARAVQRRQEQLSRQVRDRLVRPQHNAQPRTWEAGESRSAGGGRDRRRGAEVDSLRLRLRLVRGDVQLCSVARVRAHRLVFVVLAGSARHASDAQQKVQGERRGDDRPDEKNLRQIVIEWQIVDGDRVRGKGDARPRVGGHAVARRAASRADGTRGVHGHRGVRGAEEGQGGGGREHQALPRRIQLKSAAAGRPVGWCNADTFQRHERTAATRAAAFHVGGRHRAALVEAVLSAGACDFVQARLRDGRWHGAERRSVGGVHILGAEAAAVRRRVHRARVGVAEGPARDARIG